MILLLGGTTESVLCSELLDDMGVAYIVSVATTEGVSLYPAHVKQITGRMDAMDMMRFIEEKSVNLVLDASHPFASKLTENAVTAAELSSVPLLRFERETWQPELSDTIIYVNGYKEAALEARESGGKVLLTTGSNNIVDFTELVSPEKIVARVLDTSESVDKCLRAGIHSEQIIASRGVATESENEKLIKKFSIDMLITKESGVNGGMREKITAAGKAGIRSVIIRRPSFAGIQLLSSYEDLEKMLKEKIYGE